MATAYDGSYRSGPICQRSPPGMALRIATALFIDHAPLDGERTQFAGSTDLGARLGGNGPQPFAREHRLANGVLGDGTQRPACARDERTNRLGQKRAED